MPKPPEDPRHDIPLPGIVAPHDLAGDRQFAMTLARGMEILRAYSSGGRVAVFLGNRELSDRTGLPRPTVSRLTYTLTLLGYLEHDRDSGKYRLGARLLSLCHPMLSGMAVRSLARPVMVDLARATGCTVNLGVLDVLGVVYVDSVRADGGNRHLPDIGSTRPLLRASIGRAMLLACAPAEQEILLNRLTLAMPEEVRRMRPALDRDRRRFAQQGYCLSEGDWQADIHAVAVPARLPRWERQMAMNCTLDIRALPDGAERLARAAEALKQAVAEIETAYAGSPA